MASNLDTTTRAYALFKQGDIPTLVNDIIDETCVWKVPGPTDKLPWAGTFRGKRGVADFFTRVAQSLDFTDFAPHEMLEQGEMVVVLGTSTARVKRTGKTISDDWVHILKYRQGRLVSFQEYADTAAAVDGMS